LSGFGEVLFSRSRFVRLALSPPIALFAVVMPLVIPRWSPAAVMVVFAMDMGCVALLIGFWAPPRISHSAFRVLAGLVFLCSAFYLIDELVSGGSWFRSSKSSADPSPMNAYRAFAAFGFPSLWYAVFGRFRPRRRVLDRLKEESESKRWGRI
jgi:hypothetical protein